MATRVSAPAGKVRSRPRRISVPARKAGSFLEEAGRMYSVGLEALHAAFRRPWPTQEFLDQVWFLAVVVQHATTSSYFTGFNELAQLPDLFMALLKAGIFGYVAGMVACYKGFYAKGGPKGVGDAVNQAVVITFLLLFFLNFILTALYFNFVPQKL